MITINFDVSNCCTGNDWNNTRLANRMRKETLHQTSYEFLVARKKYKP